MWFLYKGLCVLPRTSTSPVAVVEMLTNIYLPALPPEKAYLPRHREALPAPPRRFLYCCTPSSHGNFMEVTRFWLLPQFPVLSFLPFARSVALFLSLYEETKEGLSLSHLEHR